MDKKFKIGDNVRFVKKDVYHASPYMDESVGQEGVVTEEGDDDIHVKFADGNKWYFDGSGLELVAKDVAIAPIVKAKPVKKEKDVFKFNIGDRVKVVEAKVAAPQAGGYVVDLQDYVGEIGTITERMAQYEGGWYRLFASDQHQGWAYDERCLKRIRKAKPIAAPVAALNPVKPQVGQEAIIEAPRAAVEAPKAIADVPKKVRTEFQVEDRVICIESIDQILMEGIEYTIERIYREYCKVKGLGKDYYLARFKHAIVYYEEQHAVAAAPVAPVKKEEPKKPTLLETLRARTGNDPHVCSYGKEFADGTFKMHVRDICHARIPTYAECEVVRLALDIKGHSFQMEKGDKQKSYHRYVNYILNYSPWAPIFHKKGLENALQYGILVDVDKPMYQCQAAAVVLREGSEYSQKLVLFCVLLDKGYSGNTAYLLSSSVKGTLGALMFSGLDNQHKVLSGEQDAEALFEFFRNGYAVRKEDKPYRTHNKRSEGIYNFIAPEAPFGKQINKLLKEEMNIKTGAGWDVNYKITDEAFFAYADKLETLLNKE